MNELETVEWVLRGHKSVFGSGPSKKDMRKCIKRLDKENKLLKEQLDAKNR